MAELGPAMAVVLTQVAKLVKRLDDAAIEQLISGVTKIELLPKKAVVTMPLDLEEVASRIRGLDREEQIVALLNRDKRLGTPQLKKLAEVLNVPLPTGARAKGPIQLHIAQSMARHQARTFGGA